jgi:hypothetical protein
VGVDGDASDFDYGSATAPPGALFVAAEELVLVYPSVAAAERNLEAVDVENGVYPVAYGPKGEPYRISSEGNRVIIEPTGEPRRPNELRSLLLLYLERTGRAPDTRPAFDDLIAMVWASESDFWNEHDPYSDRFAPRIPAWGCVAFMAVVAAALYFTLR